MPRYFIEVSYKGTLYSGFQRQHNAVTIQSKVEEALQTVFRKTLLLTGSSRTDAGVHALQNYFHFEVNENILGLADRLSDKHNLERAVYSLNSILTDDIVIKKIFKVDDKSHSRFDALSREYSYYIYQNKNPFYRDRGFFYPYNMDILKLREAAEIILNTNDFTSFSKRNTQVNNFICSIIKSEWRNENDMIVYNVIGNRFLRGMVRGLVGTMLKVGTGKMTINDFNEVIKSNDRNNADFSVPPQGLFLIRIKYPYI